MEIACLDLEGVLIPEIWIEFANKVGIEELKATTRDIPDYDELMQQRLRILSEHGFKIQDIQEVIATLAPLDGAREFVDWLRERFQVKSDGVDATARSLSGGNLQKFIVGREINQSPSVLVVSQPTWGVDAGAAQAIHRALRLLAENGAAILVISQDLDELMAISDRIAAICAGSLSVALDTGSVTIEQIGLMMAGVEQDAATAEALS